MLVLEGPDMVGKTTTAHALIKQMHEHSGRYGSLPAIYSHFSRLPTTWHYVLSYLPYITRYTIQDRFHLSEMCYGPVCRDRDPFTEDMIRVIEAHMMLAGSYSVLITATPEFLEWQWKKTEKDRKSGGRVEMYGLDQIQKVNELYENLQDRHPEARVDKHFRLDACDDSAFLSQRVAVLDEILMEWSRRVCYIFTHTRNFYGSPNRETDQVRPLL